MIRGPGGTIWGSNAVNGVINVITKSSRDTVGTLVFRGRGNVDQGRVGIRYGGGRGEAFHYRAYGSGFVRAAEHHTDGHPFDDWRIGQAGFRIDATGKSGQTLDRRGRRLQRQRGRAAERRLVLSSRPADHRRRLTACPAAISWRTGNAISSGGGGVRRSCVSTIEPTAMPFTSANRETRSMVTSCTIRRSAVGITCRGERVRESARADFTTVYPTLTFSPENRAHRFMSVFAQDEIAVVRDALWLTLGSKVEHNNDSGIEIQPSVAPPLAADCTRNGVDLGDPGGAHAVPDRHRPAPDRFRTGRSAGLSGRDRLQGFPIGEPGRCRGGLSAAARVTALSGRDGVPQQLRRSRRLRRLRGDRGAPADSASAVCPSLRERDPRDDRRFRAVARLVGRRPGWS